MQYLIFDHDQQRVDFQRFALIVNCQLSIVNLVIPDLY